MNNFVFLANKGYFNCGIFLRVIPGFVNQTGNPAQTNAGTEPGYTIPDELPAKAANPAQQYPLGSLAMANTGQPNTGGSQFFIVAGPQGETLPNTYSLFGQVTSGMSVVDTINKQGSANGIPPDVTQRIISVTINDELGPHHGHTNSPEADGSSPQQRKFDEEPPMIIDTDKRYVATMVTSHGTMVIALDPLAAPKTVNSFVFLARYHYYDGIVFHRIIPGFVLQGGDPPGRARAARATASTTSCRPAGRYQVGSLAMANAGPNTNGSQFFVISGPDGVRLPPLYSLFGEVVSGLDVVETIDNVGQPLRHADRAGRDRERHHRGEGLDYPPVCGGAEIGVHLANDAVEVIVRGSIPKCSMPSAVEPRGAGEPLGCHRRR